MSFNQFFKLDQRKGGTAELLSIAFPMMISAACDVIMTFTDRLFLSRLGPEQMNAALAGGITMQLMIFFFIGITGYTTALVGQYIGAGQKKMGAIAAFQAVIIAFIAYPLVLICRPLAHHYFDSVGLSPDQLHYQQIYFNIIIYGAIAAILRSSLGCYFSGIGRTKVVMFANMLAMVINLVLDYIMIFGKFGFPRMGVEGAAIATVIGGVSGLVVLIIAYIGPKNWHEYSLAGSFRFEPKVMRKLLFFGYPAGLELFFNFLAYNLLVSVFHSHGSVVATGTSIMFNWDLVSFIPLLGIEIGVTSLVGRYMGAGDPDTAHKAAMSGIKAGILYSVIILILFVAIPGALAMMFKPANPDEIFNQAFPIARSMIRLAALYVLVEAVMLAIVGALRGAGDTFYTMIISVASHWTMLPVVYIVMNVLELSAVFAWLALIIVFLLFCAVLVLRYRSKKWQRIRVIEQITTAEL
jgi:MATE family multidrug resistance protein